MVRYITIGVLATSLHYEVVRGWSVLGCFMRDIYGIEGQCK